MIDYSEDEIKDREMILYSSIEVGGFIGSLKEILYPPSSKIAYILTINHVERYIESSLFKEVLNSSKPVNFSTIKRGGLIYLYNDPWANISEIKELYDVIFRLEFERVPTIIHDFPEVAKWRLEIGK